MIQISETTERSASQDTNRLASGGPSMLSSAVRSFADPDACAAAIRQSSCHHRAGTFHRKNHPYRSASSMDAAVLRQPAAPRAHYAAIPGTDCKTSWPTTVRPVDLPGNRSFGRNFAGLLPRAARDKPQAIPACTPHASCGTGPTASRARHGDSDRGRIALWLLAIRAFRGCISGAIR